MVRVRMYYANPTIAADTMTMSLAQRHLCCSLCECAIINSSDEHTCGKKSFYSWFSSVQRIELTLMVRCWLFQISVNADFRSAVKSDIKFYRSIRSKYENIYDYSISRYRACDTNILNRAVKCLEIKVFPVTSSSIPLNASESTAL